MIFNHVEAIDSLVPRDSLSALVPVANKIAYVFHCGRATFGAPALPLKYPMCVLGSALSPEQSFYARPDVGWCSHAAL